MLGGVGIDPSSIAFGAHGTFGPVFARNLRVRPGIEVGTGEITTFLGFNLDFVYSFPGMNPDNEWFPFIGIGPTFGLKHRNLDVGDEYRRHLRHRRRGGRGRPEPVRLQRHRF